MSQTPSRHQALISRILTFSCVDGPGNRLVIFFQGCNFNCLNCHNPQTINVCNHCRECVPNCPANALSINEQQKVIWDKSRCTHCDTCLTICPHSSDPKVETYSLETLLSIIKKHCLFLSGITVSGGEASLQLPFIIELFKAIKASPQLQHLSCFIDSNGYLSSQGWQHILPFTDGVMLDLKSWQQETHLWITGRAQHRVIQSIRLVADFGKLHELRLLHIPDKSDYLTEIDALSEFINQLPKTVTIRLNAFQHHGVKGKALTWKTCTQAEIDSFYALLAKKTTNPIKRPNLINLSSD